MANVNAPFGFELLDTYGKEVRVNYYTKKTGSAIYPGDPVTQQATGDVQVMANGDANKMVGIAAEYKAATDVTDIAIYDDPNQLYKVQASANVAAADVFQNADIIATAGDSTLKQSRMALDTGNLAATATLPFKILGLVVQGTNAYGSYAVLKVKPNQTAFSAGVLGV